MNARNDCKYAFRMRISNWIPAYACSFHTLSISTLCVLVCVCVSAENGRKHVLFLIQDVALGDYRILCALGSYNDWTKTTPSTVFAWTVSRASFIHSFNHSLNIMRSKIFHVTSSYRCSLALYQRTGNIILSNHLTFAFRIISYGVEFHLYQVCFRLKSKRLEWRPYWRYF